MAGHSQFKNIMHRKGAQDAKRAKLFTRMLREITIAARENNEARLRTAVENAKKHNVPKKNIEKAMESSENVGEVVRYEGFVFGVGMIVEAITDNKNRTAGAVRSIFNKYNGSISNTNHLFREVYMYEFKGSEEEVLEKAISIDCDEYLNRGNNEWLIISEDKNIGEKGYVPITPCNTEDIESIEKFVHEMSDLQDVQEVWTQLE